MKILEEEWGGEDGWFEVLRPIEKALACGDVGDGAMMAWEDIVSIVEQRLGLGI
jgi:phosphopantothenoylcysteine decarboxylase